MNSLLSQSESTHGYFFFALKLTPITVATKEYYNYNHLMPLLKCMFAKGIK